MRKQLNRNNLKLAYAENCALLNYYTACSGNSFSGFSGKPVSPIFIGHPLPPKMGPIGCSEMPVRNYCYSLRNDPEECSSHLLRGGILEARFSVCCR
jgi:hypothetical protein